VVGLRDRALIGVMVFTFARISAACGHERGRHLPPAAVAMGAPAREGRQVPRDLLAFNDQSLVRIAVYFGWRRTWNYRLEEGLVKPAA